MTSASSSATLTRDFTVAVFVVCQQRVLLHFHPKLSKWLPPGGHIEPNELPDDAAIREVAEESDLDVVLVGSKGLPADYPDQPVQLTIPAGVQLEFISSNHEHIDFVYFAVPANASENALPVPHEAFHWLRGDELDRYQIPDEVRDWCERALREITA